MIVPWRLKHELLKRATTEAELLRGLPTMAIGKSKAQKVSLLDEILREDFGGFILPFESKAAAFYAEFSRTAKPSTALSQFWIA